MERVRCEVWLTKRRFQACPENHVLDMDRLAAIIRCFRPLIIHAPPSFRSTQPHQPHLPLGPLTAYPGLQLKRGSGELAPDASRVGGGAAAQRFCAVGEEDGDGLPAAGDQVPACHPARVGGRPAQAGAHLHLGPLQVRGGAHPAHPYHRALVVVSCASCLERVACSLSHPHHPPSGFFYKVVLGARCRR